MVVGRVGISWHALLIIPLLAELSVLALGLAFALSALFVKFRDMSYIWDVLMQAGFYATPILYSLSQIARSNAVQAKILILNPVAQIIQDARYVLVTPTNATIRSLYPTRPWVWVLPIVLCVVIAVCGGTYFRARSRFFAEEV
jgi:ABC-2 type transport system permease protein